VHVLPQLRELEERFPDTVVVIGVHSGKFVAERVTERIREAAARHGVRHAVVNDRHFRVWRSYAVRAWPTLAVVDPAGYVLGLHAGEFTSAKLAPLLERMIDTFTLTGAMTPGAAAAPGGDSRHQPPTVLRYPGKVAVDARRIAVADTGHHRVLVGRLADSGRRMRVERVVDGGGESPLGAPQGLVFGGDTLYVADAGSHTVRAIDLGTGTLRTVAGTGRQLRTQRDLEAGALSSPWDLALVGDTLYIAMAGTHQLWAVHTSGAGLRLHAGARGEDVRDGPLADALLAQPMGLDADAGHLYFVDAETSAVRTASLDPSGAVATIVGTGLFDFGDADGRGDDVRLQHPQAIVLHPSGRLLVADSYNDALKWVDPATRTAQSWLRGFHEPGGLALGDGLVYVADTNAHRIAVVDEATGDVGELTIEL
jgi:DNA-binding beta-propeller fold protein YncE